MSYDTLSDRINFSFVSNYQVKIASGLRVVSCVHVSSHQWNSNQYNIQALYMFSQYLWVHMFTGLAVFRMPFSLVSSIPSSSYILSAAFSSLGFPEYCQEEFGEYIPFRTEDFKVSHSAKHLTSSLNLFPSTVWEHISEDSWDWFMIITGCH